MTKEEAIQKESERRYPLDSCTDLPHPFAYEKAEDILDKRVLFREGAKWAMEEYREQRWVRVADHTLPLETMILVKHKFGVEAIQFFNAMWRYPYSGTPVGMEVLSTMTYFLIPEPPKD